MATVNLQRGVQSDVLGHLNNPRPGQDTREGIDIRLASHWLMHCTAL